MLLETMALQLGDIPVEDLECLSCKTTWAQRLREVMEQTDHLYTTPYPCIFKCGQRSYFQRRRAATRQCYKLFGGS